MFNESGLSVPYEENVVQFETGQTLMIHGTANGDRIDINLVDSDLGSAESGDIPFHMSARVGENRFVFNSYTGGQWGAEEEAKLNTKQGDKFTFHIRPHGDKIEVFSNGHSVHNFNHRQSLNNVKRFIISGDVTLGHAKICGEYNSMPFEKSITGGFQSVDFQGIMEKNAKRLDINFWAGDDIALHINPRIDEKAIVLNSKTSSGWGNEERNAGSFPLTKGDIFDITVVNGRASFQLHINGQEFTTFGHRMDANKINKISVEGDIVLTHAHVH